MLVLSLTSVSELKADANTEYLDNCLYQIGKEDTEALSELYNKTSSSVYAFALSVLKNSQDAEDVLHDCYVSIYSSAAKYRSNGKPMAWIITIAKNLCLQKLRERKKGSDIPEEDWERYMESKPEVSTEDKMVLSECMKRLSDEERQIVILHAVSGFKHREIAEIMDMRLPTVLSKYNRALKKLKDLLTEGDEQS